MAYINGKEILFSASIGSGNGGETKPTQNKYITITENTTTMVTPDMGYTLESVQIKTDVPTSGGEATPTQEKTVDVTENGTVEITPDSGYALSKATVNVNVPSTIPEGYIKPAGKFDITANGDYDITNYASVAVNVPTSGGGGGGELEAPTISISDNIATITDSNEATTGFAVYVDGALKTIVTKGETLDLSTLDLEAGTYTLKAKAIIESGFGNEVECEIVSASVAGTWIPKAIMTYPYPDRNTNELYDWAIDGYIDGDKSKVATKLRVNSGDSSNPRFVRLIVGTNHLAIYNFNINSAPSQITSLTITTEGDVISPVGNYSLLEFLELNFTRDTTTAAEALNIITEGEQ